MLKLSLYFSLVMINLIIAIIISDIQELKLDVKIQDTINKAYHAITYNKVFGYTPLSDKKDICIHKVCYGCNGIKICKNTQQDLLTIVRSKKEYREYPE